MGMPLALLHSTWMCAISHLHRMHCLPKDSLQPCMSAGECGAVLQGFAGGPGSRRAAGRAGRVARKAAPEAAEGSQGSHGSTHYHSAYPRRRSGSCPPCSGMRPGGRCGVPAACAPLGDAGPGSACDEARGGGRDPRPRGGCAAAGAGATAGGAAAPVRRPARPAARGQVG